MHRAERCARARLRLALGAIALSAVLAALAPPARADGGAVPLPIVLTFNDYVQDINSWGECKRAGEDLCPVKP